jgi:hypothetical protein
MGGKSKRKRWKRIEKATPALGFAAYFQWLGSFKSQMRHGATRLVEELRYRDLLTSYLTMSQPGA